MGSLSARKPECPRANIEKSKISESRSYFATSIGYESWIKPIRLRNGECMAGKFNCKRLIRIYLTDTDPLVYNSFNEDLSDSDADSDSDGITNRKEIDIGTNPLNPDTDGDEIKLKLDPTASRRTDHTAYDIQRSGIYSKLSHTIFSAIGQNQMI